MATVGDVIQTGVAPSPPLIFTQFLSLDNDGATFDASVDGSVTPQNFDFGSSTDTYLIERMMTKIEDGGIWATNKYGSLTALTTGIDVCVLDPDDVVIMNLIDGLRIQTTPGWQRYCYDGQLVQFPGGDDYFVNRWTFAKHGAPILLKPDYKLRVIINDDLTALSTHLFCVEGTIVGTGGY